MNFDDKCPRCGNSSKMKSISVLHGKPVYKDTMGCWIKNTYINTHRENCPNFVPKHSLKGVWIRLKRRLKT